MRLITGNPKFDYVLLCNKVCGVAHYNMKLKMVIESASDFKKWYKEQSYVFAKPEAAPAVEPASLKDTVKIAESGTAAKVVATR